MSFDIDANGIMKVSAKDQATGKDQSLVIQPSGGLNKTEIDEMVKNAESHRESDLAKRESIEVKNNLDSQVHNITKSKDENKDKLSEEIISEIDAALAQAKSALAQEDVEVIKTAKTTLEAASLKIGQAIYSQQD